MNFEDFKFLMTALGTAAGTLTVVYCACRFRCNCESESRASVSKEKHTACKHSVRRGGQQHRRSSATALLIHTGRKGSGVSIEVKSEDGRTHHCDDSHASNETSSNELDTTTLSP